MVCVTDKVLVFIPDENIKRVLWYTAKMYDDGTIKITHIWDSWIVYDKNGSLFAAREELIRNHIGA